MIFDDFASTPTTPLLLQGEEGLARKRKNQCARPKENYMIFTSTKLPENATAAEVIAAYNALIEKLSVVLTNIDNDNLSEEFINEKH